MIPRAEVDPFGADGKLRTVGVGVAMHRERELLHIVETLHTSPRFPSRLNRGQEQPYQHSDNSDNNKQFYEGEPLR